MVQRDRTRRNCPFYTVEGRARIYPARNDAPHFVRIFYEIVSSRDIAIFVSFRNSDRCNESFVPSCSFSLISINLIVDSTIEASSVGKKRTKRG